MSEQDNPQLDQETPESPQDQTPKSIPYEVFRKTNKQMREYEAEVLSLREAEKARREAEALARGEHEKVIAELKPQAERAAQLEKTVNQLLEKQLEALTDEQRASVDAVFSQIPTAEGRLLAFENLRGMFQSSTAEKPVPPNYDAGQGERREQGAPKLSQKQQDLIAIARQSGYRIDPNNIGKRGRSRYVPTVVNQTKSDEE